MTVEGRRILVVYLSPPWSLGKSAQMLTLKYLRRLGWAPTVITTTREGIVREPFIDWHGVEVVTSYPSANRLWRLSQALYRARSRSATLSYALYPATATLSFPDRYRHAATELLDLARSLNKDRGFQAVLSVYDHHTSHAVARQFAEEERVPWLTIIKDYYSKPPYLVSNHLDGVLNRFKIAHEKQVLRDCRALLPVNDNMTEHYRRLLPGARVETFTHCYDEEDFDANRAAAPIPGGIFRILWLGEVQRDDSKDLRLFFNVLGRLVQEGTVDSESFRARFVGPGSSMAGAFAKGCGCEELVDTVPNVSHHDAMSELKNATCLLYTQSHHGSRRRLPEYLTSRKPILVFPEIGQAMSNGVMRSYGAAAVVPADKDRIKETLADWVGRFQTEGRLELPVNEETIRSFSAQRLAGQLNDLLEEFVVARVPKRNNLSPR